LLPEFDTKILDKPRKDNVVVDFLYRLAIDNECMPVEDYFLDEYISSISTHSLWYADITNYLVAGRLQKHLSSHEKRRVFHKSVRYS